MSARERMPVLALLLAHLALALGFARHAAPTWDETVTFGQGLRLLETRRWDFPGLIAHPPLSFYLQSLPLLWIGIDQRGSWDYTDAPSGSGYRAWLGAPDVERGRSLYYRNATRFGEDALMFFTRIPNVALGALTGLLLFLWSRELHGARGALLTLALFALSPNTIAHGGLATTDMTMMLFSVASAFAIWRAVRAPGVPRSVLAGVAFGLALLSKYTALLLLLPFTLLVLLSAVRSPEAKPRALGRAAVLLAVLLATAVLILTLGYQGTLEAFLDGVRFQRENVARGQTGYLMGEIRAHGWWYYYPAVMALKTPLAEIGLSLLGAWLWLRHERLSTRLLFATVPFLFLLAWFSFQQVPVGLRHVLPVYPAFLLAAGAVPGSLHQHRIRNILSGLGVVWIAVATLAVHPHQLGYFNEAAGGSRNGWRWLDDSNVDWGQDLPDLRDWMQAHHVDSIPLAYFGTADPAYYGIRYQPLPSFFLPRLPQPDQPLPPHGLVAISATCRNGAPWSPPRPYDFLLDREPLEVVGTSFLIYRLP